MVFLLPLLRAKAAPSQMLVPLDLIVELEEDRLHGCGQLHVQIEEIDDEGHSDKGDHDQKQLHQSVFDIFHECYIPSSITGIPHRPVFRETGQQATICLIFISLPCCSQVSPLPQWGQVFPY